MKSSELLSIHTIPKRVAESLFAQSDQRLIHTPYKDEIRLLSCIKDGDLDRLIASIQPFFESGIFVGEMSDNNLMQYRYMAVSAITLATRYAIQGGLDENKAYNFSDSFIRAIDGYDTTGEIFQCLASKIIELTNMVKDNKEKMIYSPHIRKAVAYIKQNITMRLSVSEIAGQCGISADYLSYLFKKEMGCNLSSFVLREKLELSKTLLWEGYDSKRICTSLGFCSQSHFISSFKKEYGQTPNEYLLQNK
ncbi:MAG: AraC family transcriptional regulator [Clostridium sp.]|nr:AraC family transcriptional regulator [Clostridium sp.]